MNLDFFLSDLPYSAESKLELADFELKDKTPAAFLDNFLDVYSSTHLTMRNGMAHCKIDKNRTLAETFLITRNYFPDLTLKKFFGDLTNHLIRSKKDESRISLRCKYVFVCTDIGQAVITKNSSFSYNESLKGYVWAYNYNCRKDKNNPAAFECFADFQDKYLIKR